MRRAHVSDRLRSRLALAPPLRRAGTSASTARQPAAAPASRGVGVRVRRPSTGGGARTPTSPVAEGEVRHAWWSRSTTPTRPGRRSSWRCPGSRHTKASPTAVRSSPTPEVRAVRGSLRRDLRAVRAGQAGTDLRLVRHGPARGRGQPAGADLRRPVLRWDREPYRAHDAGDRGLLARARPRSTPPTAAPSKAARAAAAPQDHRQRGRLRAAPAGHRRSEQVTFYGCVVRHLSSPRSTPPSTPSRLKAHGPGRGDQRRHGSGTAPTSTRTTRSRRPSRSSSRGSASTPSSTASGLAARRSRERYEKLQQAADQEPSGRQGRSGRARRRGARCGLQRPGVARRRRGAR